MPPLDMPPSTSEWIDSAAPENRVTPVKTEPPVSTRGPIVSAEGTSGLQIVTRDRKPLAAWQLTEPLARHATDGVTDDVPSARAVPVWYFPRDPAGDPRNQYLDAGANSRSVRVYHVGGLTGDRRDSIIAGAGEPGELGTPKFTTGDRVLAAWNPQNGRWEILATAEEIWRFELKTALAPSPDPDVPSTADAYLVVFDSSQGRYVKTGIEFPVADFLNAHTATAGCRGHAKRLADSAIAVGWEILSLHSP